MLRINNRGFKILMRHKNGNAKLLNTFTEERVFGVPD